MATTTGVGLTGNADIDGVLSGVKWADPHITFSFPTSLSQYGYAETGFQAMNATQIAAVRGIMDLYESYTGLVLTEITETTTSHATIRFAEEDNAGTAYAYYPSSSEWGGDVWLNHVDYNTPLRGTYAYATFLHELGHALGLDHGQDGLAALPYNHDSLEYSVMTYRSFVGADLNGYTALEGSFPQTLMMDDIAALQYMYGANYSTNATNTTYTWSTTTGEMSINGVGQGASTANKIFLTVWDGGGTDTYDFSNYTTNLTVDLSPGGWSTASAAQLADLGIWAGGNYARGNIANAYLFGGNTASLIENAVGGTGNDSITGNQANNSLSGGNGNDTLLGGDGNDTLAGGNGNDIIVGGNGVDYCIINANYATCTVTYDDITSIFSIQTLLAGLDLVSSVEYFTFTDSVVAASTLMGPDLTAPLLLSSSPSDDASSVARGANIIFTFSEAVVATAGLVVIHHGDGSVAASIQANDLSQISISGGVVTINPAGDLSAASSYYVTIDTGAFRDAAGNLFSGFSASDTLNFSTAASVINGTSSANTLNGTADADTLNGLGGNDTLNGLAGNDTLDGGTGYDRMTGGLGDDTYIVDNTRDTVVEASGQGTDTVRSSVRFTLGSNIENLVLTGSGSISGTGNSLDNSITGNAASNTLSGAGGNDILRGDGGVDTLSGGIGNDTLNGGLGKDVLSGGTGKDVFDFDAPLGTANVDRISDFSVIDDTIRLHTSVFSALAPGALAADAFTFGAAALDAQDRIIYNSSTGALYYDPDGVGGVAQQQFATLGTGLGLTAADFLLSA